MENEMRVLSIHSRIDFFLCSFKAFREIIRYQNGKALRDPRKNKNKRPDSWIWCLGRKGRRDFYRQCTVMPGDLLLGENTTEMESLLGSLDTSSKF